MYKSLKVEKGCLSHKSPKKSNKHEGGKVQYNTFPHATEQWLLRRGRSPPVKDLDTRLLKTLFNEPIVPVIVVETVNHEVNPALAEDA